MSEHAIIADSGPLIALARVERLVLLQELFGVVRIPEAVMREVTQGVADGRPGAAEIRAAAWIEVAHVDPATTAGYEVLVDAGEAAAIALAKREGGLLLMDDVKVGASPCASASRSRAPSGCSSSPSGVDTSSAFAPCLPPSCTTVFTYLKGSWMPRCRRQASRGRLP